jgi:hypothetical protein
VKKCAFYKLNYPLNSRFFEIVDKNKPKTIARQFLGKAAKQQLQKKANQ